MPSPTLKYQLQKRGTEAANPALQISRAQGQINDLRSESTELAQTTKALRAEVLDLRAGFTAMSKRMESVQAENTGMRKELTQMAACLAQFNSHLEATVQAVQGSTAALASASKALEKQEQQESRQQKEIREELEGQREEHQAFTATLKKDRRKIGDQLDQLGEVESQLQRNAAQAAQALAESVAKLGGQTHERVTELCAGIQRLAQQEQDGLSQMAGGFQRVLDCEKNLSELFSGVAGALNSLAQHSEQVLVEDRRARLDQLQNEAAHFNGLGLKCLADGRLEEAIRKFEQARECAPKAFEPAFNLTIAQLRLGLPVLAQTLADELLQAFPERPELPFLRGVVSLALQDYPGAQHHLGLLSGSAGRHDSALAAAGLAHLLNGDAPSAAAAFRRAAASPRPEAQMFRKMGFEATAAF